MAYSYSPKLKRFRDSNGRFISKHRGLLSSAARAQYKKSLRKKRPPVTRLIDLVKDRPVDIGKPESPGGQSVKKRLSQDLRLKPKQNKNLFIYRKKSELYEHHKQFDVTYLTQDPEEAQYVKHFVFKLTAVRPIDIIDGNEYFGKPLRDYVMPALDVNDDTDLKLVKILYWKTINAPVDIAKNRKFKKRRNLSRKNKR